MMRPCLIGRRRLSGARRRPTLPALEAFEERLLLTTFTVINTKDDVNPGSLRWAIGQANGSAGNTINFVIPGSGAQSIALTAPLPAITQSMTIDGTTQTGYNNQPLIELNGAGAGSASTVDGLDVNAANVVIKALAINRFAGAGVKFASTGSDTLQDSDIGTDPTGSVARPNGTDGVLIAAGADQDMILHDVISANGGNGINLAGTDATHLVTRTTIQSSNIGLNAAGNTGLGNKGNGIELKYAPNTQIGGTSANLRNLISANAEGVNLSTGSDSTKVQGNYIGTDVLGASALGNTKSGVIFTGASFVLIGGTASGAGNLISGNLSKGVDSFVIGSSNETIQGNIVGLDATGTKKLGNVSDGVYVSGPTTALIGGTTPGARNIISANGGIGVDTFASAVNYTIQGNYIGTDITGTTALGNSGDGVFIWSPTNTIIGGTAPGAGNVISGNTAGPP
jgi:hypothetical protein